MTHGPVTAVRAVRPAVRRGERVWVGTAECGHAFVRPQAGWWKHEAPTRIRCEPCVGDRRRVTFTRPGRPRTVAPQQPAERRA